ncbi:MAG: acetoin utilization protein AcuC [Kocuria sp.]|nr:acetoin utilization protein AcuC [Kocuria sp.]
MHPSRLEATWRLVQEYGLDRRDAVTVEVPEVAEDAQLTVVHTPDYVAAVREVSQDPTVSRPESGLGTEDTPGYAGIHEASARLVGGSVQAAQAIVDGAAVRAVNFGGGMHHAFANKASGFCVYNDCAVAIRHLLNSGVQRVLYLDVDGHHGDGTQSIFFDTPEVMTISIHESGATLFPGTGFANEVGIGEAAGTAVNIAMPPTAEDAQWLRAYHAVVPALVEQFRPDVIVSQHGCDSHVSDPLTHLRVSIDGQREIMLHVRQMADRFCDGRWIATGGGGYDCYDAVPRSWSHLVAVATGDALPVTAAVPAQWREYVQQHYGSTPPEFMGDRVDLWWRSWEIGFDPDDDTDRAVMATRREIFPRWGLDPWYD